MASAGIKQAVKEAKAMRKKHPNKYNHLRKKDRWSKGYMRNAFATVSKGTKRKSATKPRRKVGAPKKKKAAKRTKARKRSTKGLKLIKAVTKTTNEQVLAGKRRKRSRRRSGSIGTAYRRRRSVGRHGGNTGLIVGLGLGALALVLLMGNKQQPPTTYQGVQLPSLQQTGNYTRDNKANELVSYAAAAGLAVDAIIKLIDRLNLSNDNEVSNIYDHVNTTGDVGAWV